MVRSNASSLPIVPLRAPGSGVRWRGLAIARDRRAAT
jgi:hypothetical protein